jgi:hypothetical protein
MCAFVTALPASCPIATLKASVDEVEFIENKAISPIVTNLLPLASKSKSPNHIAIL